MVVQRRPTNIDPIFWKPDDVYDFTQVDEDGLINGHEDYSFGYGDFETIADIESNDENEIDEETAEVELLPAASSFELISQTARVNLDGKHVIDVVIEVADLPGVEAYNVRLTS